MLTGNGSIDFDEFLEMMATKMNDQSNDEQDELLEAFKGKTVVTFLII